MLTRDTYLSSYVKNDIKNIDSHLYVKNEDCGWKIFHLLFSQHTSAISKKMSQLKANVWQNEILVVIVQKQFIIFRGQHPPISQQRIYDPPILWKLSLKVKRWRIFHFESWTFFMRYDTSLGKRANRRIHLCHQVSKKVFSWNEHHHFFDLTSRLPILVPIWLIKLQDDVGSGFSKAQRNF